MNFEDLKVPFYQVFGFFCFSNYYPKKLFLILSKTKIYTLSINIIQILIKTLKNVYNYIPDLFEFYRLYALNYTIILQMNIYLQIKLNTFTIIVPFY